MTLIHRWLVSALVAGIAVFVAPPIRASVDDLGMVNETPPSLTGAVEWLNSKPLNGTELRGKVVLVEFWTYTCVNWLRTLPYVRAWAEKYKNKGLVVIGVHTPEFGFEKDVDNIRRSMMKMRIRLQSIAITQFGTLSATSIGPRCILSTRRAGFATIISAKANTSGLNG